MKKEKIVIGQNYPKVGDTIYWEDYDGNLHDNVVLRVDKDPEGIYVTNYFIKDGYCECFIDEESLIHPESDKIKKFKNSLIKREEKEITQYLSQEDVRHIIYKKLCTSFSKDDIDNIIDLLTK